MAPPTLTQIYEHIDNREFKKAVKLCTASQGACPDILKAYCLLKLQKYEESASLVISTFQNVSNYADILLDVSILETAIITYHQIPKHIIASLSPTPGTDALSSALDEITKSPLLKNANANLPTEEISKFYQSYIRHVLRIASVSPSPTPDLLTCAAISTKISKFNKRWKFIAGVFYGLGKDGMGGMAGKMGVRMMEDGIDDCGEHEVFSYTSLQSSLSPSDSVSSSILEKLSSIKARTTTSEIHDEMTILENDGCLVKASRRDVQREIIEWSRKLGKGLSASMEAIKQGDVDWEVLKNALEDAKTSDPPAVDSYLEFLASKDVPDSKAHRNIKLAVLHATLALNLPISALSQSYYTLFGEMEECHLDLSPFLASADTNFWVLEFDRLKAAVESKTAANVEGAEELIRRYYTVARILLFLDQPISSSATHKHLEHSVTLLGSDPVPDPSLPPPPPPKYRDQRAYDNLTHILFELTPRKTSEGSDIFFQLNRYTLARLALERSNHNHTLAIRMIRSCHALGSLPPTVMKAWNKLEVKQIQLLTISHLVMPLFYKVGMYAEIVLMSSDIMLVCSDMKKRLGDSAWKCVENGTYRSLEDIMTWWRRKFHNAAQRFEGFWGTVECGVAGGDVLGETDGIFGGPEDGKRAEMFFERLDEFQLREVWDREEFKADSFNDIRDNVEKEDNLESLDDVVWRIGRGIKVVKLATHAAFLKGKYKHPKKGKVDKKSVELGERVKVACEELERFLVSDSNASRNNVVQNKLLEAITFAARALVTVTANDAEDKTKECIDKAANLISEVTALITASESVSHGLLTEKFVTMVCTSLTSCIIPLSSILSSLAFVGKKRKSANPQGLLKLLVDMVDVLIDKFGSVVNTTGCDFKSQVDGLKREGGCEQLVSDSDLAQSYKEIVEGNNITRERIVTVLRELSRANGANIIS